MSAVADNKKIVLDIADVTIDYRTRPDKKWLTSFNVRIDIGSGLTRRERTILFNSARHCEVTKLLAGEKTFEYELVPDVS